MIEGEVTSRRALRDAYRDAIEEELGSRILTLSSGELDGVPVVTMPNIEEAILAVFAGTPPGSPDGFAEVSTPANVLVHAECPRCGIPAEINVVLGAVLTVDSDGAELSAKAKSKARTHVCGQLPLPAGEKIEGEQTEIDFDAIVGQTTEELVVVRDYVTTPGYVPEDEPAGRDICEAEAEIPNIEEPADELEPTLSVICRREIDHDDDHFDPIAGVGWYYETVPVAQGVAGNEDAPVGPAEEGENDGDTND